MKKIEIITSAENPLIRRLSMLIRSPRRAVKENVFFVEGLRLAEMAVQSNWAILHAGVTEHAMKMERMQLLLTKLSARNIPIASVSERLFSACSETDSPQGIILLLQRLPCTPLEEMVQVTEGLPLYLALDRVQDPGNVGTILRTADAAGASGVILLRGCADVYGSKVVRAAMGSLFYLPFVTGVDEEDLVRFAKENVLCFYAAACDTDGVTHFAAELSRPSLVVLGNEANGVSERLLRAGQHLYVPMCGRAESLNVAAAATAILYEAIRQRKYAGI